MALEKQNVAIASDHAGFELKEIVKTELAQLQVTAHDLGPNDTQSVDYPDYANTLAAWVKGDENRKGILICGSGIGMSIAANRHAGIRAALCHDAETATLARKHNDANVLCLGARLMTETTAKACVHAFLTTAFEGGRHGARVAKLG